MIQNVRVTCGTLLGVAVAFTSTRSARSASRGCEEVDICMVVTLLLDCLRGLELSLRTPRAVPTASACDLQAQIDQRLPTFIGAHACYVAPDCRQNRQRVVELPVQSEVEQRLMFARRLRGVNLRHAFEFAAAWVRSNDARLPRVRAALNEFAADLGGDTEARHIGRELERQEESVTVGSEAASNRRLHQTASVLRVGRQ